MFTHRPLRQVDLTRVPLHPLVVPNTVPLNYHEENTRGTICEKMPQSKSQRSWIKVFFLFPPI